MCGIAGTLAAGRGGEDHLWRMIACINHRGPDDCGIWFDPDCGAGLAHARLSIIDLSPAGHQPMTSVSGRYVLVFNGEIYNHLLLRAELTKSGRLLAYRGHSDTETILAGFEAWGIEGTVQRALGMFAFAVWDRDTRTLTLGRDRLGEKPLYYCWAGDAFLFGSELSALRSHPAFISEIDRDTVALLMRHSYIPAPWSIYRGVRKLAPGTLLTVRRGERDGMPVAYWQARQAVEAGNANSFQGTPNAAVDELERLLSDAVCGQMMTDVPLGAFLSGGVDSSTIVALMQKHSATPVKTFTIGFREAQYDEASHARAVAAHLGTDHTELYVTPEEALNVIPRLPTLYSEPFADSSQIPTFLLSELTRRHVTVSLSGDGGDELFAGYNRYVLGQRLWGTLSRLPRMLRRAVARGIMSIPAASWNRVAGPLQQLLPASLAQTNIGDKLFKGAGVLNAGSAADLYLKLVSQWDNPTTLVLGAVEPQTVVTDSSQHPDISDFVSSMMALDLMTYLPDDILVKVDRAAMGVSLETRVPFLDHRLVEFAWSLPLSYKLRDGVGKWPLRQVLYRHVPRSLIERPKMGFGVPIGPWLRGPLRNWAEDLLAEPRLRQDGFFDPSLVRQKWEEHLSGKRDWQYHLWNVLAFQAWYAETR